jgi:hypothetical protein
MSFLHDCRLVFNGRFQADVSTVNNDVRHYDNATFDESFQEFQSPQQGGPLNGWWNPPGTGAFRLIDCRVVFAGRANGDMISDDPVLGSVIGGASGNTSGKLVDIDPQWQLASAPWGLEIRISDRRGAPLLKGRYRAHAFRDLWFGRMLGSNGSPAGGDGAASATFQSVLYDLEWSSAYRSSPSMVELRELSQETDLLSIRLTTFGFRDRDRNSGDFTTGRVVGAIGPQLKDEPESFVAGRRFAPANGQTSWNGCSYFCGRVDHAAKRLILDLSNALQLAYPNADPTQGPTVPVGTLNNIGVLRVGILKDPHVVEFTPANAENFLPIAEIAGYSPSSDETPPEIPWISRTGGVVSLHLSEQHLTLVNDHPLALAARADLNAGSGRNGEFGQIAIRETTGGSFVEAEPIVHRIDSPGGSSVALRALRYGTPVPTAKIAISQLGRMPGQGGGDPNSQPQTKIPPIGVPMEALTIPAEISTGEDGKASFEIKAADPGNPRAYIDGQIYLIDFRLPGQGNQARSGFDYVVVHVRDAFTLPGAPQWSDIEPIMQQYANLYPIMSRSLFNLADQKTVDRHAQVLRLAFSAKMDDPNHMPVTRDLSAGKRQMIIAYLDSVLRRSEAPNVASAAAAGPSHPRPQVSRPTEVTAPSDSKSRAAREFARATGLPDPT